MNIERVILGAQSTSRDNFRRKETHMSWDKRIRNDELVARPRQPCHIEGPYLFSELPTTKIWAVDAKDRPFFIIMFVVKLLRYDPPLASLISQLWRSPAANSLHLKNLERTTEKSLVG
jgi:hypothetical protein